MILCPRVWS